VSNSGLAEDKGCCEKAQPSQRILISKRREARMRIAAGILMITYGVKEIGFCVGSQIEWGFHGYPFEVSLVIILSAVFIINGGVFCLKRKYWKLCFASSLFLLLFMIFDLYFLFPVPFELNILRWLDTLLSVPWGILPQIFVCLKKSEWQEISA
jgi:hypothetical protein